MANEDTVHRSELPKIVDDGTNNNYGEWETKSYHKLRDWNLLKYIEGPESNPPIIPVLRNTVTHHGIDDEGNLSTVHVAGNLAEHEQATQDAQPWMAGNNTALAKIVSAVPSHQLHLVKRVQYAKQAWDSLRSVYQPRNSLRAATIKGQIMAYRCQPDMNVAKWLTDMQRLYNSLCDLDTDRMSDRDFAFAILDLMPQDEGWRDFVSGLRSKVRECDAQLLPVDSTTFITAIRDEYWYRHKDDYNTASHIFSARFEAQTQKRLTKRARNGDTFAASASAKRLRTSSPSVDKSTRHCSNPDCGAPRGHNTEDCVAFGGGSVGQYGDWWKGPWNIHLPKAQRTMDNNVPPKSHPAHARLVKPSISHSFTPTDSLSRSTTDPLPTTNDSPQPANDSSNANNVYAWQTHVDNEVVVASLPVLDLELPRENLCHHDSGANRHVFHDRSVFDTYQVITPLPVRGFGKNLSTFAIGRGTVRLQGSYGSKTCSIILDNVLHIPAARSNLISGIQLDKAGVLSTLGNGSALLSVNGKVIIDGNIVNDMYRLNLRVVRTESTSNNSTIPPPYPRSLLSRIGPTASVADTNSAGFCTA